MPIVSARWFANNIFFVALAIDARYPFDGESAGTSGPTHETESSRTFYAFPAGRQKKKKNNFFRVFYREVAQDRSKNAPGDDCRKRLGRRQGWAGLVAGIGMESERIAGATGTPDPDCYGRGENHAAVSISERRRIVRLGPG